MKKIFLPLLMCAALCSAQQANAEANIYAYGLKVNSNAEVQFTLNATPTSVAVNFYKDATLVHTINVENAVKGENKVAVDLSAATGVANGDQLTWEVVASAAANESAVKFSDDTQVAQQFFRSSGVAVNTNPASPNFGNIYVSNSIPGDAAARNTPDGIYILDASLTDVTGQGNTPYTGGITWVDNAKLTSVASPHRIALDEEDNLFICDWSDGHSGVYVMDTNNPSADFKEIFGGTRDGNGLASEGGVNIHGSISALCVTGKGTDRALYTYDEDYTNTLLKYEIGTFETPWVAAPSWELVEPDDLVLNNGGTGYIISDKRGGLWVSQSRQGAVEKYDCLIHLNSNNEIDYRYGTLITSGGNYSMALNVAGDKMVVGDGKKNILVFAVSYDDAGVPTLTQDENATVATDTAKPYAIAVDVAENVYLVGTDVDHIMAYALPKAENTFTTPANETVTAEKSAIETIAADNAPVEYFNLQGVKVAAPENGIFIKRQGAKATKVVL